MKKKTKKHTKKKNSKTSRPLTLGIAIVALVAIVVYLFMPAKKSTQQKPRPAAQPALKTDPFADSLAKADLSAGKKLFESNCTACHGPGGRGQDPARPMGGEDAGVPLAPALNGTGHTWHHPPSMLFGIIRNGSQDPSSPMRGFRDRLTDEQIMQVLAYTMSMWPGDIRSRYQMRFGI